MIPLFLILMTRVCRDALNPLISRIKKKEFCKLHLLYCKVVGTYLEILTSKFHFSKKMFRSVCRSDNFTAHWYPPRKRPRNTRVNAIYARIDAMSKNNLRVTLVGYLLYCPPSSLTPERGWLRPTPLLCV